MLIIERHGTGYRVRAKEAGYGRRGPKVQTRTVDEAAKCVVHYFGDGKQRHIGQVRHCPFCQQMRSRSEGLRGEPC